MLNLSDTILDFLLNYSLLFAIVILTFITVLSNYQSQRRKKELMQLGNELGLQLQRHFGLFNPWYALVGIYKGKNLEIKDSFANGYYFSSTTITYGDRSEKIFKPYFSTVNFGMFKNRLEAYYYATPERIKAKLADLV